MTDRVYAAHPSDRTARAEAHLTSATMLIREYEEILDVVHERQGTGSAFGALIRLCSTALARVELLEGQQPGIGGGFVGGRPGRERKARRRRKADRSSPRERDERRAAMQLYGGRGKVIALPLNREDGPA
jgi:hypothetical protein